MFLVSTPRRVGYSLKTRLYSIIAFLGLLPVLGASFALVAIEFPAGRCGFGSRSPRHDQSRAGQRAGLRRRYGIARHLHVRGLDGRGIVREEPYAPARRASGRGAGVEGRRRCPHSNPTSKIWRRGSINSCVSGQSWCASGRTRARRHARAFGDNDANRTVRTALNNSLHTVAHAYEQEIAIARSQVEADERYFLEILLAVAILGAVALGCGLLFVKAELLTPVLRMRASMLRLAQGDLDFAIEGQQCAHELAEMARAVEVFHTTLTERQKLNRETRCSRT
jgi:hypothetical protein